MWHSPNGLHDLTYICVMKFQTRLNRFLIGIVIGLLLVAVFFGGRDWFSWLPGPRVKAQLTEWYQAPDGELEAQLICSGISADLIKRMFEDGDVDFRRSEVRQLPKLYWVGYDDEKLGHIDIQFAIQGETARIVDWAPKKECQ